jgi:hypothetical protein
MHHLPVGDIGTIWQNLSANEEIPGGPTMEEVGSGVSKVDSSVRF